LFRISYDIPFIVFCYIVEFDGTTNHSGSALTALINEINNLGLWVLYFADLQEKAGHPKPYDPKRFCSCVQCTFHGDDLVVANFDPTIDMTSSGFRDFVKPLGFIFTPSDKTTEFKEHKTIKTVQYLKRFPAFVNASISGEAGYIRAQRPIKDIYQALYWWGVKPERMSSKGVLLPAEPFDHIWCISVLDSCLKDISHYPRDIFNAERRKLIVVAEKLALMWRPKDYDSLLVECGFELLVDREDFDL
jgi:hypothetical protein